MMRISYYLHESGNYIVFAPALNQRISCCPGAFRKKVNMIGSVIVGCQDVEFQTAALIGFVFPAAYTATAG